MNQNFTHILTVQFNHRYFHDNRFRPIQISCDEPTIQFLRNLEMVFKTFPGGFHLLAADPELLKSEHDLTPLRFRFNCTDSYFVNYSDLPSYNLRNNLFYCNNLTPNVNGPQLFLHDGDYVTSKDLIKVSSQIIETPQTENVLFKDAKENVLVPLKQNHTPHGTAYQFSGTDEGIIWIETETAERFSVYYTNKNLWNKPLGILEIFPDELFNHFTAYGKVDYMIRFDQRSTVWKYFLVDPVYRKFSNLVIINTAYPF
ncbi:MAG: hypothetical protein ACK5M7_18445 [Draconibacterium sp.]